MVLITIGAISSVYVIRYLVKKTLVSDQGVADENATTYSSTVASIMNALQIQVSDNKA
jgi:hypothetical protein